ncbi:hypothetical protein MUK42_36030 [Musa troglodytarum]|uniref:Uncharacterized protein n=1 Tax=Musa troglodytarum TaxID=320322 RepID=A0A9E7E9H4_9LILI|nr:hypothetical protein MUK42_36030 [Musa troglodytarum]
MAPPTDLAKEGKIAFAMLEEYLGRRRRPPPPPPLPLPPTPRNAAPVREQVIGGHQVAVVIERYSAVRKFRWGNYNGGTFP